MDAVQQQRAQRCSVHDGAALAVGFRADRGAAFGHRAREPHLLAMAEALACGTPVLAFPNGAAPEVLDDGKTGCLCRDETQMVDAVTRVASLDRHDCRAAAEQRFDLARMAVDHEFLYLSLVAHEWAGVTFDPSRANDRR